MKLTVHVRRATTDQRIIFAFSSPSVHGPCQPRTRSKDVDKAPERDEAVDAAGVFVIAKNALDAQHDTTSTSNGSCFPGSYRRRVFDEAIRIRNMFGVSTRRPQRERLFRLNGLRFDFHGAIALPAKPDRREPRHRDR